MTDAQRCAKRALDIVFSGAALTAALPLLLGASAAVLAAMGRPVFFRQQRPGYKGKPFMLVKFRTMRPVKPGESDAATDRQRLTRTGRMLRAASIDELPTLFNVLKGDMSLVGPRPLLMRYLDRYTPEQARRHEVKPGVTGLAQIQGRNALSWEEKFSWDVWYVDNQSLRLDIKILMKTIVLVLRRRGISHSGEATMPEFLGSGQKHGADNTHDEGNKR